MFLLIFGEFTHNRGNLAILSLFFRVIVGECGLLIKPDMLSIESFKTLALVFDSN
jgi:hypothetical protein